MSEEREDGEPVFMIAPAGMLQLTGPRSTPNSRAINALINEAFAARELLKMTPQGDGTINVSVNEDPKWLERYGECRESSDDALHKSGKSPEVGKWADAD